VHGRFAPGGQGIIEREAQHSRREAVWTKVIPSQAENSPIAFVLAGVGTPLVLSVPRQSATRRHPPIAVPAPT
jgi:hypothetical protein